MSNATRDCANGLANVAHGMMDGPVAESLASTIIFFDQSASKAERIYLMFGHNCPCEIADEYLQLDGGYRDIMDYPIALLRQFKGAARLMATYRQS